MIMVMMDKMAIPFSPTHSLSICVAGGYWQWKGWCWDYMEFGYGRSLATSLLGRNLNPVWLMCRNRYRIFLIIPASPLSLPSFFLTTHVKGYAFHCLKVFILTFLHIIYCLIFIFILAFHTTSNSPFELHVQSSRLLLKVSYCLYSPLLLCLFPLYQLFVIVLYLAYSIFDVS
jgi:hypothetical protein